MPVNVWWIQGALWLSDNPALTAGASGRAAVVPLFIWDPELDGFSPGEASRRWLHHSFVGLLRDLS